VIRRKVAALGCALVLALVLGACGASAPTKAFPVPGAQLGGAGPGSLLSAVTMPKLDPSVAEAGIRAARITYVSTDENGSPSVVAGSVFVPDRKAPRAGWRVVALGHGSTGIQRGCAPSSTDDLAGQVSLVIKLVGLGVAVTMTDYQGLGAAGVHGYTDARTAGLNVIDSVRAARKVFPGINNRWAAFGGSQGGGAVWAADEQASTYAPELHLVGAIALSPAADLTGLVDKAVAGTLTRDQRFAFQWILASLGALHPDLDLDDYRSGSAARDWDELSRCEVQKVRDKLEIGPDDLAPKTAAAEDRVRSYLAAWALPQRALSAPLFVSYGEKDQFIDSIWTTRALAKACRLGGTIEAVLDPNGTHAKSEAGDPVQWLAARFAGEPAVNQCP
jgi:pimeloyl-ACP methyl ester carboxylesterase